MRRPNRRGRCSFVCVLVVGNLIEILAGIMLSGMLTVVVGRAVFGSTITIGEAWKRIRGRLLPLIGLALLEVVGVLVIVAAVVW